MKPTLEQKKLMNATFLGVFAAPQSPLAEEEKEIATDKAKAEKDVHNERMAAIRAAQKERSEARAASSPTQGPAETAVAVEQPQAKGKPMGRQSTELLLSNAYALIEAAKKRHLSICLCPLNADARTLMQKDGYHIGRAMTESATADHVVTWGDLGDYNRVRYAVRYAKENGQARVSVGFRLTPGVSQMLRRDGFAVDQQETCYPTVSWATQGITIKRRQGL